MCYYYVTGIQYEEDKVTPPGVGDEVTPQVGEDEVTREGSPPGND